MIGPIRVLPSATSARSNLPEWTQEQCRALWCAVVQRAIEDCRFLCSHHADDHGIGADALAWCLAPHHKADREEIEQMAGLAPGMVEELSRKFIKREVHPYVLAALTTAQREWIDGR